MRDLLPFIVTGVVTGSLYGLSGVGLVLTYRTSGVFNFAHGAIAAAAAYTFYTLHITHGLPWPLAALATLAVYGLITGWLMERSGRILSRAGDVLAVAGTVAVLLAVQGVLYLVYGNVARLFPDFLPTDGFVVEGVTISWSQIISVGVAAGTTAGLYVFLGRSSLGVAMRAVVDNPGLVELAGDNPIKVRRAAWMIGNAFAALSGILLAPTLNLNVGLLTLLVVQAFGACAIGRFSSLPLTYIGGIGVGVVASVATRYLDTPPWNGVPSAVPFLVLVAVLVLMPGRLPVRSAGAVAAAARLPTRSSRSTIASAIAGVGVLVAIPIFAGTYLPVWTSGLVSLIIFGSLAIVVWTSGQMSLGHMAFVAVGATTMSHLTTDRNLPWGLALVLAGLAAIPFGAVVAVPAIRLSGIYLALATLGFGILMQSVVFPTFFMFGDGLTVTAARPQLGWLDGANDRHYYAVVAVVAVGCLVALVVLTRSRLGRLLRAMSEAPTMLATHGLAVNLTRIAVFCISAFFAGVAGALTVGQFGSVYAASFGPIQSLMLLAVLAMCGTRFLRSSIAAAFVLSVGPAYAADSGALDFLGQSERQTLVFGVVAVLAVLATASRAEIAAWLGEQAERSQRRGAIKRRSRSAGNDVVRTVLT